MRRLLSVAALAFTAVALALMPASAFAPPVPPTGLSAIALDGRVELAWQAVAGASGYTVYRGTSPAAVTTRLSSALGVAGPAYTDTTAVNTTTYSYAVRAVAAGVESPSSLVVQATPRARSCTAGNPVVVENCFPGNSGFRATSVGAVPGTGIEGYATKASINRGESVDLKVNTTAGVSYRIEVFRTGYYGGAGSRLISTVRGVQGVAQPGCSTDGTTGLVDCGNWSTSYTLTTTSSWPSGVYMLRLVRDDNADDYNVLVVVRDDASTSALLYGAAFTDYQAYNNYGGRSLYDFNSTGGTTVSGTARAVKVSFDRPFEQVRSGLRDWYPRIDSPLVNWLEKSGYDVTYQSNTDMERTPGRVLTHRAYLSPAHDEYYSAGMRTALEQARGAGVHLFFTGSNGSYWKVRFEADPASGSQDRVMVCYKSTQSGGADPSGIPTGTWRDPAGANNPENALIGMMYVGDNDNGFFPIRIGQAQGTDRVFRSTGLDTQSPGTFTDIGPSIVGWEWDARVANGREPAGVKTLAATPVTGNLIQNNGANSTPGSTTVNMSKYTHASGALVVATGTNYWARGLAQNAFGLGEPDLRIQQTTTNILADMGAQPATPASGIVLDNPPAQPPPPSGVTGQALGADGARITWNAVAGAQGYNVYRSTAPREGGQPFGPRANAAMITSGTSFDDTGLAPATNYYYIVTAVVAGTQSPPSTEITIQIPAAAGEATRVNTGGPDYTTVAGQLFRADTFLTGGSTFSTSQAITGTTDPAIYQDERWGNFTYAIPVANGTYQVRLHFAEIYYGTSVAGGAGKRIFGMDVLNTPASPDIANIDIYAAVGARHALVRTINDVNVTNGVLGIKSVYGPVDDPQLAGIEVVPQAAPPVAPTVASTVPAAGATGVARSATVRATFSRDMNAATITGSSFTLTPQGGSPVAAGVSYDASTRVATLTPSAPLSYSTSYTARVTTAAQASDGMALTGDVTWGFTVADPVALTVTGNVPAAGASGVAATIQPRATFSRSIDAATLSATSFTLRSGAAPPVPATVAYDDATRTATLSPSAPLAFGTSYTARLETTVHSTDDVGLTGPVTWTFTTAATPPPPPTITTHLPASDAVSVVRTAATEATFSRDMDPVTLTTTSFTLTPQGGSPVNASVAYDSGTRTARLTPLSTLQYATLYTARIAGTVAAADQTPVGSDVAWSFTTQDPPPPPTVIARAPADNAAYIARSATATATFSRDMDPATISSSSVSLAGPSGVVTAAVSYDPVSRVATVTPDGLLAGGTTYTATIQITVTAADGTALASPVTWSFTTAACPCSLFPASTTPTTQSIPTRDGRPLPGPWSYELGVQIRLDEPMLLTAVRFFKSPGETGTHTGRVWTVGGTLLGQVDFANETPSGWQRQALATPIKLAAGTTFVVSVNANELFGTTTAGLASPVVRGPLRTIAGQNGVYGPAAGVFPTNSWNSSNYFTDLEVIPDGDQPAPTVTARIPAAGATGAARDAAIRATFSRPMDPETVNSSTVRLTTGAGVSVAASVAYDEATQSAILTPSGPLAYSSTYTMTLTTAIRASDAMPLAAPVTWSFTIAAAVPPTVTSTDPAVGAAGVDPASPVLAVFSKSVQPATVTGATFTLTGPSGPIAGAVTYNVAALSARFQPQVALAEGAYTARLGASITSVDDVPMGADHTWSFTVPPLAPPLAISDRTPSAGAGAVSRDALVEVVFNRAVNPATVNAGTFVLRGPDGIAIPAAVSYDPTTRTATLRPGDLLAAGVLHTAQVTTGVQTTTGEALPNLSSWSFTTDLCACSFLTNPSTPLLTNLPTSDGRTGAGPWTYELGLKLTVTQATSLTAIRFFKSSQETGTHVGRVWAANGTQLAQVTFTGESTSGWQRQYLSSPITLQPGQEYVVSIGFNQYFSVTGAGLSSQLIAGPARTVVGGNGVFATAAGAFPTQSYNNGNYFVDLVVR